jgi:hypothetical protein
MRLWSRTFGSYFQLLLTCPVQPIRLALGSCGKISLYSALRFNSGADLSHLSGNCIAALCAAHWCYEDADSKSNADSCGKSENKSQSAVFAAYCSAHYFGRVPDLVEHGLPCAIRLIQNLKACSKERFQNSIHDFPPSVFHTIPGSYSRPSGTSPKRTDFFLNVPSKSVIGENKAITL